MVNYFVSLIFYLEHHNYICKLCSVNNALFQIAVKCFSQHSNGHDMQIHGLNKESIYDTIKSTLIRINQHGFEFTSLYCMKISRIRYTKKVLTLPDFLWNSDTRDITALTTVLHATSCCLCHQVSMYHCTLVQPPINKSWKNFIAGPHDLLGNCKS